MSQNNWSKEQPAVVTTIVGGRPPGCGQPVGPIPYGLEILVKKASVDPEFKSRLIAKRAEVAGEIGLTLEPAEAAMLAAIPAAQLEQTIAGAKVRPEHRSIFLGKAAAVMLAALGILGCDCNSKYNPVSMGIQPAIPPDKSPAVTAPDRPNPPTNQAPAPTPSETTSKGIRPDRPSRNS